MNGYSFPQIPYAGNGTTGGHFQIGIMSGAIAGALTPPNQILTIRWNDTTKYMIPVKLRLDVVCTAFSTGVSLDLAAYVARQMTTASSGTGSAAVTNPTRSSSGKMNHSILTSNGEFRAAGTTTLTAGTQSLDAAPFASGVVQLKAAQDCGSVALYDWNNYGQYPLQLGNNEGIVVRLETFALAASNTISIRGIYEWIETPFSPAG